MHMPTDQYIYFMVFAHYMVLACVRILIVSYTKSMLKHAILRYGAPKLVAHPAPCSGGQYIRNTMAQPCTSSRCAVLP